MRRAGCLLVVIVAAVGTLHFPTADAWAVNGPPLWILQQNRRAAEEYHRSQQGPRATSGARARTPTRAVATPAAIDR